MGDREFLRRALLLFASAGLMLSACFKHESMLCGEQEPCPSGYACSEGVCESQDTDTRCPANPPLEQTIVSNVELTCNYGEECCCGVCHPNITCRALPGEEIACFFTDACLIPQCK